MRYFLIEIDGDQEELFFRFNLPFIQENLSKGVNISLEEDLISRGWCKSNFRNRRRAMLSEKYQRCIN